MTIFEYSRLSAEDQKLAIKLLNDHTNPSRFILHKHAEFKDIYFKQRTDRQRVYVGYKFNEETYELPKWYTLK